MCKNSRTTQMRVNAIVGAKRDALRARYVHSKERTETGEMQETRPDPKTPTKTLSGTICSRVQRPRLGREGHATVPTGQYLSGPLR
jgi:hypothetical protein